MSKKVLVFGGSGFLGTYVVQNLLKRKYEVVVADLRESEYFDAKIIQHCDIMNKNQIQTIVNQGFDYIYNFAGFASLDKSISFPVETMNLNVIGNMNILESCKELNIKRFIYASSAYAMSDKGSFYGISKLASEKLIEEYHRKYGLTYTIVRYGSVYSEREFENNYIYNLVKQVVLTQQIQHQGDGEEVREYIHAADAAKLSVDVIETQEFENTHLILTGVEKIRRKELFLLIKEILNQDIKIELHNNNTEHYQYTPYTFHPAVSKKLVANPFIDMGQGILECIKEIHNKYAKNA